MLNRYPHTAVIVLELKLKGQDTGILTKAEKQTQYELQGRLETSSSNQSKYNAIFFTTQSEQFKIFEQDKATLTCLGRKFKVSRLIPYQTHTEIWLVD